MLYGNRCLNTKGWKGNANQNAANLRYKLKKRQVKVLKRFAQAMKWPNLNATMENLRVHDEEFRLDTISSDAFAFFSGLVLPGVSFSLLPFF